jgi:hypothetical protein
MRLPEAALYPTGGNTMTATFEVRRVSVWQDECALCENHQLDPLGTAGFFLPDGGVQVCGSCVEERDPEFYLVGRSWIYADRLGVRVVHNADVTGDEWVIVARGEDGQPAKPWKELSEWMSSRQEVVRWLKDRLFGELRGELAL